MKITLKRAAFGFFGKFFELWDNILDLYGQMDMACFGSSVLVWDLVITPK